MRTSRLVPAALILGSALLLGGCVQISDMLGGGETAVRDADSGEVTDAGQVDVFTLAVGDCLNDQSGEEVYDVPVVPCAEPHDYEVYHDFAMPDGEYPGQDATYTAADEGCYAAFAPFVGLAYEESILDFSYYVPTQQSWDEGNDRLISCFLGDPSTQTTGSLAGVAR